MFDFGFFKGVKIKIYQTSNPRYNYYNKNKIRN